MKIKNRQLAQAFYFLNNVKGAALSIEQIKKIRTLRSALKEAGKEYEETRAEKIKGEEDPTPEVKKEIFDFDNSEVEVPAVGLTEDEALKITKDFSLAEQDFLIDILTR
jgi:hypothetical protein